jgi:hypothetical protein
MTLVKERANHAPLVVQWPLLYANMELIGQGTLLNLSHRGCQIAGTMPVAAGMVLKVWISPAHRDGALYVKEARVVWAQANQFELELRHVDSQDHKWLMGYLENAELRVV